MRWYRIAVDFDVPRHTVLVQADSLEDAWTRRHELLASEEPEPKDWTARPVSVETADV